MEYVYKKVEELVKDEITDATERLGLYHSWHEKYAIMLEEMEKLEHEVQLTKDYLNSFWFGVKENIEDYAEANIPDVYEHAVKAACEAIHVAAMAKKEVDDGTADIIDHGVYR